MKPGPRPNFFIVGAPKAGTTALYSYLTQHPEVFMSRLKEPQFFASDIRGNQRNVATLSEYLHLFEDAHALAIGEASTCYLASPGAAEQIRRFCPDARIVVMLRNPVDVMYAEHSERLVDGAEYILSFSRALESYEDRKWRCGRFKGERVAVVAYRELVKFSEQISRFIDAFGRKNIHVILFDDFVSNPRDAYSKVLAFLGVCESSQCTFDVVHSNRRVKSTMVHDQLRYPPKLIRGLLHTFLPLSMRRRLGDRLNRLNIENIPRPPLDQRLRQRLNLEFSQELQDLGHLVGRDLSMWTSS
jgi:Sulfotransferase family